MPTTEGHRRRTVRWAAAAAVAVVAVGIAVGGVLLVDDPELDELMNRRVVAALERATDEPRQHGESHGHQPADPGRRADIDGHELVCVAKAFGHAPSGATAIDDVTVIYAHRMCAAVGPGLGWPDSIRETGPVAVRLGVPDTLVLPEQALPRDPDADYADRIRAVVPERHHEQALAFTDFVDPDVAAELRDRVDA